MCSPPSFCKYGRISRIMLVPAPQTVVYLDIDGVVNPFNTTPAVERKRAQYWSEWKTLRVADATIIYAPELVTRLNSLTGEAHVVFLSMWMETAVKEFAPAVGLHVDEFADADGWNRVSERYILSVKERWWKLNLVIERMDASPSPVVWIDDWMTSSVKTFVEEYAAEKGVDILVVKPDERYGLTPAMMNRIDRFVAKMNKS